MSRIRDVLKRAALERSIYDGIGLEEVEAQAPRSAPVPIPMTPVEEAVLGHSVLSAPPASSPKSPDSLLAQCSGTTWIPDKKTMLFFGSKEQVHGAEQFRTLRSQLYQLRGRQSLRKILVTSSVPKEGRSFVAANLAQVMACQAGCRTVLIDADLRNPALHLALGTSGTPGLSEYLLGDQKEPAIIQRGQMENLFFIASGRPTSGQTELVSNGRLKLLLDHLESLFEWIIIDSPAAMPVSDSSVIANVCDGVLMVVRSNSTPFDVVRKARQKFQDERVLGVVLNGIPADVDPRVQHYYKVPGPGPSEPKRE
jgi:protein-tyrosine kinase